VCAGAVQDGDPKRGAGAQRPHPATPQRSAGNERNRPPNGPPPRRGGRGVQGGRRAAEGRRERGHVRGGARRGGCAQGPCRTGTQSGARERSDPTPRPRSEARGTSATDRQTDRQIVLFRVRRRGGERSPRHAAARAACGVRE
jgi:hypothetical protein